MNNVKRVCPKCGRSYTEYPAISRRDNAKICPECGQKEALEDYFKFSNKNNGGAV